MLDGGNTSPPEDGGSDRGFEGPTVSFLFCSYANVSPTNTHRSAGQVAQTSLTPSRVSPAVIADPSTTILRHPTARPKTSVGGDGATIPYEVGISQPEPVPPSPSEDDIKGHLVHELIHGVAGGTTDRPSSRRPSDSGGASLPFFLAIDLKSMG